MKKNMEKRKWTTTEETLLRAMFALGKSCHDIAAVLNRTHASVETRATRLHLARPAGVKVEKRKMTATRRSAPTDEYIDCIPNPFARLKGYGFDVNFYRKR